MVEGSEQTNKMGAKVSCSVYEVWQIFTRRVRIEFMLSYEY